MKRKLISFVVILALMLSVADAHAATVDYSAISVSLLNQDPDPAVAGSILETRLGIVNSGTSAANNFVMELTPAYPFSLLPGDSGVQNIVTISAYQTGDQNTQIVKYRVNVDKNAPAGTYDLNVKYYQSGSSVVVYKNIPISVSGKESAEILIDRTSLVPGQQSSIKFTIKNVGTAPLRDMAFSWENPEKVILPVGSDNIKYINYLDVGSSTDVEYNVIADTNAVLGLYQLNLKLSYAQSGNSSAKTTSTIAGVYVGGETDFDVAFSDSSTGLTSFTIANVGNTPANSVSVSIPQQSGWTVSGSNSVMLGNLNVGDYTVASFKLQYRRGNFTAGNATLQNRRGTNATPLNATQNRIAQFSNSSAAPGEIVLQVAYTDTMGTRRTLEKDVMVGALGNFSASGFSGSGGSAQASSSTSYTTYIIAIAILAAVYFAYRKYGKPKGGSNHSHDRHE